MKTQREVFNKLFKEEKTELSTQKVELGAIDDLRNLITDAKRIISLQEDGVKWGNKAENQYKEVKKVVNDAEGITRGAIRQAGNLKKESQSIFNKVEISAKDLGIDVNSIKEYKEAFKLISKMFENQNELNGWNDFLKKLK
jgi:hypothetical protein